MSRTAFSGLVAAIALMAAAPASAQWARDGYDLETAPGYDRPDREVVVEERELVQPFNSGTSGQDAELDAPINEFAGQRRRFEPGLIGEALGGVKRSILNSGSTTE